MPTKFRSQTFLSRACTVGRASRKLGERSFGVRGGGVPQESNDMLETPGPPGEEVARVPQRTSKRATRTGARTGAHQGKGIRKKRNSTKKAGGGGGGERTKDEN